MLLAFLTTPFLGLMYYFIPKAANRPVYRLSIIHFWSNFYLYLGSPHHLLYSALQTGHKIWCCFSIMLIAHLGRRNDQRTLTLRGVWDKVRVEPVLKFFSSNYRMEWPL
jgi:cytochrome c oxidase cbb3-type subunit I/II